MDSRGLILARVRANHPAAEALPASPEFPRVIDSPWDDFAAALARMGGTVAAPAPDQSLDAWLRERFADARVICSAVPEAEGTRRPDPTQPPAALDDVDVGVVRAAFGVAETGSVGLSECEFGVNALGFLSQHLVVLLDPAAIVADLHQVYRDQAFFGARYAVLMTGPSATADIEGVLVRGAQGIRTLTVIPQAGQRSAQ
ncbi:LutC/YkgG family protein [Pseudaquabacterium terrae]|uniref:LutC/YkgG family protein n=1 Tax=Pseudaquabacterium terrae TaxID=2732868 RepID=UPI0031B5DE07